MPPTRSARSCCCCALARERSGGWFDPWALPGGVDPTGLVKGWAAARALDVLRRAGVSSAMVSAGGDVATLGHPEARSAPVRGASAITHPWDPDGLAGVVEVCGGGAVCTSGTYARGAHLLRPHHRRARPAHGVGHRDRARRWPWPTPWPRPSPSEAMRPWPRWTTWTGYEGWLIRPDGSDAATGGWRFASARPAAASAVDPRCTRRWPGTRWRPGEGALRTVTTWPRPPARPMRKSSTRLPSASTAWARTPAGAGTTSPTVHLRHQPAGLGDEGPPSTPIPSNSRSPGRQCWPGHAAKAGPGAASPAGRRAGCPGAGTPPGPGPARRWGPRRRRRRPAG